MPKPVMEKNFLLGFGLDGAKRHKRFTKGKNFYIFGGSRITHKKIQTLCLHFNRELFRRKKTLAKLSQREFFEIASRVGAKVVKYEA
jgi:hypothetical protein